MFQCCTHTVPLGCTGKVNHQEDMQLLSLLLRWKPLGWEESLFAEDGLVKCSQEAWLPGPGRPIHPIACGSFLRPAEKREQQHPLWITETAASQLKSKLNSVSPNPHQDWPVLSGTHWLCQPEKTSCNRKQHTRAKPAERLKVAFSEATVSNLHVGSGHFLSWAPCALIQKNFSSKVVKDGNSHLLPRQILWRGHQTSFLFGQVLGPFFSRFHQQSLLWATWVPQGLKQCAPVGPHTQSSLWAGLLCEVHHKVGQLRPKGLCGTWPPMHPPRISIHLLYQCRQKRL